MSKIALLDDRVKKLDKLSKDVDNEIAKEKKNGYKDTPKYLTELQSEIATQKALCEQEKKILEEATALKAELKKPGKPEQEVVDGKARKEELQQEYDKLVKDNATLHGATSGGAAEPCIPCMLKKAQQQNPVKHFIKFNVVDSAGKPRKNVSFQVELPDGNTRDVTSGSKTVDIMNIEPGNCKIELKWHPGATVYDAVLIS